jgi:hypothetical protein
MNRNRFAYHKQYGLVPTYMDNRIGCSQRSLCASLTARKESDRGKGPEALYLTTEGQYEDEGLQ